MCKEGCACGEITWICTLFSCALCSHLYWRRLVTLLSVSKGALIIRKGSAVGGATIIVSLLHFSCFRAWRMGNSRKAMWVQLWGRRAYFMHCIYFVKPFCALLAKICQSTDWYTITLYSLPTKGYPSYEDDNGGWKAGSCGLSDQICPTPPNGNTMVYLPNVWLCPLPVRLDREHHTFTLHKRISIQVMIIMIWTMPCLPCLPCLH